MAKIRLMERISVPTYGDPEQIRPGEVAFDYGKCSGCMICTQACPAQALVMDDKRPQMKPRGQNECIACGDCVAICPQGAVTLTKGYCYTGTYKTIDHGDIRPPRL